MITPFEPATPYIAADASFNTCMDSMSLVLISWRLLLTPSTIMSGELLPNAVIPLIRISLAAPGCPDVMIVTPEARPCKASSPVPTGDCFI